MFLKFADLGHLGGHLGVCCLCLCACFRVSVWACFCVFVCVVCVSVFVFLFVSVLWPKMQRTLTGGYLRERFPFACDLCDNSFRTPQGLAGHRLHKHGLAAQIAEVETNGWAQMNTRFLRNSIPGTETHILK